MLANVEQMDSMQPITAIALLQQVSLLKQLLCRYLVHKLQSLSFLNQEQFVNAISMIDVTVNRWINVQIQPSELALRPVHTFIEKLSQLTFRSIRDRDKELVSVVFAKTKGRTGKWGN